MDVALICFIVIVLPIWLMLHYHQKSVAARGLTPEDEKLLADLWRSAKQMEDRIRTLERILDADNVSWRKS